MVLRDPRMGMKLGKWRREVANAKRAPAGVCVSGCLCPGVCLVCVPRCVCAWGVFLCVFVLRRNGAAD